MRYYITLFLLFTASFSGAKPNVLFIFADDLGWGDLGCYGHPDIQTPHLDRLAEEGARFTEFTVAAPVCSPSRAALLTGRYPARYSIHHAISGPRNNRERNMPDALDWRGTLLPKLFRDAGYKTGHFGKWHLSHENSPVSPAPQQYGYEVSSIFTGPGPKVWEDSSFADKAGNAHDPVGAAFLSRAAAEKATEFLEAHPDVPFFMTYWPLESHHLVAATEEDKAAYPDTPEPQRTYYAAVTRLDELVGDLVAVLEQQGRLDETIILFSSDNGPEHSQDEPDDKLYYSVGSAGDRTGMKRSLYMGGVNVPFIVRWPAKVPAGHVDEITPISAVDMLPTLCAAAHLDLPEDYTSDGENMFPVLRGKSRERTHPLFWEWQGEHRRDPDWADFSMRDGSWTYLMNLETDRRELFDLASDPGQARNLVDNFPDKAAKMERAILEWKLTLPTNPPSLPRTSEASEKKAPRTREDIFTHWDADKDSLLSLEEYSQGIKGHERAAERFAQFDANEDGGITVEEFSARE